MIIIIIYNTFSFLQKKLIKISRVLYLFVA